MSIANQTIDQAVALSHSLGNTLRILDIYTTNSRNPSDVTAVDAQLAALKTLLDAAVADTTVDPKNPNPENVLVPGA